MLYLHYALLPYTPNYFSLMHCESAQIKPPECFGRKSL